MVGAQDFSGHNPPSPLFSGEKFEQENWGFSIFSPKKVALPYAPLGGLTLTILEWRE